MAESNDGWGPLEIILVIVLGIAFLTYITGRSIGPGPIIPPKETAETISTPIRCGLSILRPKPLEKVSDFVTLTGTVENCSWDAQVQPVLYARIVDAGGVGVSHIVVVDLHKTSSTSATFSTSISYRTTPVSRSGYVVISNKAEMNDALTAQIPITFEEPLD
jgi:hypothetical protein